MVNYYPYFLCLLVSIHLLPTRSDGTVTKNYLSGQELPFTVEFQVVLPTGQSSFYVNVVPSWAPMAARRFRELIKERFYDNTRFHLVIPGSIVQFGISNNPKSNRRWSNRGMHDEIQVAVKNIRGRISFVKSDRPHSRRFQLFINCADNSKLDGMGYAPFGEVHGGENGKGMTIIDDIYPVQDKPIVRRIIQEGASYMEQYFPLSTVLKRVRIVESEMEL